MTYKRQIFTITYKKKVYTGDSWYFDDLYKEVNGEFCGREKIGYRLRMHEKGKMGIEDVMTAGRVERKASDKKGKPKIEVDRSWLYRAERLSTSILKSACLDIDIVYGRVL